MTLFISCVCASDLERVEQRLQYDGALDTRTCQTEVWVNKFTK